MADIPNRDELERILARKLGGLSRRQLGKLMEVLGNFEDYTSMTEAMANIPPDLWDELGKELAEVVIPFSERVYLQAAERMLETVPVGVDWALVNESASNWALQYGSELVRNINTTTQRATNQAIANFFERGWTFGDLSSRLGRIYSPVRAEMIAITEVTRAAAEGERATVREIEKEGIKMVEVWQTRNDEIVCPICGPRHGRKVGDGWSRNDGPPAHPRCRCWINHEFEKVKEEEQKGDQALIDFASQYRNSDKEHILFTDENGNILFETTGTGDRVDIPQELKDQITGSVIHNHPSGAGPSPQDLSALYGTEAKEMLVVTDPTVYRIMPGEAGTWRPSFEINQYKPGIERLYNYEIAHGANIENRGAYIARWLCDKVNYSYEEIPTDLFIGR